MELVRNKASGQFFVVLDDNGGPDFLVATPEGKVKRLDRHLFRVSNMADPEDLQLRKHLTTKQMDIYATYFNDDR